MHAYFLHATLPKFPSLPPFTYTVDNTTLHVAHVRNLRLYFLALLCLEWTFFPMAGCLHAFPVFESQDDFFLAE